MNVHTFEEKKNGSKKFLFFPNYSKMKIEVKQICKYQM